MQRLLEAVEAADPNDESEWIEFKADLDPSTKDGAATIAKAIVAFANRDPSRAQRWCGGHAYLVIGLAPGNLAGTADVDPAVLHDKVSALIASPSPDWDPTPVSYKGKPLIVITVAPPKAGDPMACIGKSSGSVTDGNVYVRVPGKSAPAKAADIRRLSDRLSPAAETLHDIAVTASEEVTAVDYPVDWLDQWIDAEEDALLGPLKPEPPWTQGKDLSNALLGFYPDALTSITRVGAAIEPQASRVNDMLRTRHEEDRTEDEFRAAVAAYLDRCREGLPEGFEVIRANAGTPVTFSITNNTDRNYSKVLVKLHIEGDVFGYDWVDEFKGWGKYVGKRPRKWGPWTTSKFPNVERPDFRYMHAVSSPSIVASAPRPHPRIENGGSVNITCVPVDLRPGETEQLLTLDLVADRCVTTEVRVTWTATATDVSGKLSDEFVIPLADERVWLDLGRDWTV
nr:ATP-binding protein [Nocardioides panzhihuensis]